MDPKRGGGVYYEPGETHPEGEGPGRREACGKNREEGNDGKDGATPLIFVPSSASQILVSRS